MATRSPVILAASKYFFIELVGDLVFFPIWWYTVGFGQFVIAQLLALRRTARHLALGLLFKTLFQPMFGQYDRSGRIISFFVRLVILIFRSIYFLFFVLGTILLIVVWLALPLTIIIRLISFLII